MDDDIELPDEFREKIEEGLSSGEIAFSDLLLGQIEALIEEAREEYHQRYEEGNTDASDYYDPYIAEPAMIWRLTDQLGIDADQVSWWFASLALKEDGSPFYIIHDGANDEYVELHICRVRANDHLALADAFEAAERHSIKERADKDKSDVNRDPALPKPERLSPIGEGTDQWETVVNPDAGDDEATLAIRRAPALDHSSLSTYVLERRQTNENGDDRVAIGTFWGHHGGSFAMQIRDAIERLD